MLGLLENKSGRLPTLPKASLQDALAEWYGRNARDLPWRRTRDPYRIWVSEVMLQQTQVTTVTAYFERFLARFPSVAALANAGLDDVLAHWQGLGYYRRAKHLHAAARLIVDRFGGNFPSGQAELLSLPGVGRYMAGAIRSFAFDLPAAIVESNTARVLSRLYGVTGPIQDGRIQKTLWELAEALVPDLGAGLHNQALTELGALVCKPNPCCERCPVRASCRAHADGMQEVIPLSKPRRQPVDLRHAVLFAQRNGRVLIVQIADGQWWSGLWELPRATVEHGETEQGCLRRFMFDRFHLKVQVGRKLCVVKHGVTHHRITLNCYEASEVQGHTLANGFADWRWERPERLHFLAFSSPQRRIIDQIVRRFRSNK